MALLIPNVFFFLSKVVFKSSPTIGTCSKPNNISLSQRLFIKDAKFICGVPNVFLHLHTPKARQNLFKTELMHETRSCYIFYQLFLFFLYYPLF